MAPFFFDLDFGGVWPRQGLTELPRKAETGRTNKGQRATRGATLALVGTRFWTRSSPESPFAAPQREIINEIMFTSSFIKNGKCLQ